MAAVREAMRDKSLSQLEVGAVSAVAVGATWTASRLADEGYDTDPGCAMCGAGARDTLFHRAWECPCSEHLRERLPGGLVQRALEAGPTSV
eukprot:11398697-Heterocapsa_arctica.AAC.1